MIIRASRKNYRVTIDESVSSLVSKYLRETKTSNVSVQSLDGENCLLFPIKTYRSEKNIEKFVNVATGGKVHKEAEGIAEKTSTVTDAELALINRHALKALKREEVSVYTMKAANNKIDRDNECFSKEVLESFAKSIVGKSWLYMHDKRSFMPFGKIFEAWTAEEAGVMWLYVKGYVLNTDTDLVQKIDSGIWKFVSIGFIAPAFMAINDAAGKLSHFEYRNIPGKEAEGLEVSLVWLGAQYDAQVSKSGDNAVAVMKEARSVLSTEQIDKCNTLDEMKSAIEQEKARRMKQGKHSHNSKGAKPMKHLMKIFGIDKVIVVGDDASDDQLIAAIQAEVDKTAVTVIDPLKAEIATLQAAAAKNATAITAFKENLVNETATLINSVTKFVDDAERTAEVTRLKGMDLDVLQKENELWKAKAEKRKAAGDAEPQTEPSGGEKKAPVMMINSVQEFA